MFIFVFVSSEMLCIFGCVTLFFSLFSHTYNGQRFTLGRTKIKSVGLSFSGMVKAMACRFQEVELCWWEKIDIGIRIIIFSLKVAKDRWLMPIFNEE